MQIRTAKKPIAQPAKAARKLPERRQKARSFRNVPARL